MIDSMKNEMDSKEGESDTPDYQAMLDQGKQLCETGDNLIAFAKSMGASDDSESESPEEDSSSGEESPEEDSGSSPMKGGDPMLSPKKAAIIIAIKKKLGRK